MNKDFLYSLVESIIIGEIVSKYQHTLNGDCLVLLLLF